ncbi:hypothetical protein SB6415_02848 [Klebsiella pasteurii]|nr:hypothetical protein SB6415_02848 [Klebsiella pasteurii]
MLAVTSWINCWRGKTPKSNKSQRLILIKGHIRISYDIYFGFFFINNNGAIVVTNNNFTNCGFIFIA